MTFESPIWLLAAGLSIVGLVLFFVVTEIRLQKKLSKFVGEQMKSPLTANYSRPKQYTKVALFIAAVAFICIALARPKLGSTYIEEKRRGVDFVIALDVSRSMLAEDIKPNRLERAKLAILDLLENAKGDRVGLVAFAGSAFLQCPLTLDYDAFRQTLNSVNTDILSTQGTDIAGALLEAEASFAKDNNHKILIMITDGEDLEAEGVIQARKANESGLTIYTVGVGLKEGELIPVKDDSGRQDWLRDPAGKLVETKLDEETLKEIALASDGNYVPLGATGNGLQVIYEHCISSIPAQEREAQLRQVAIDRYQWPLAIAIVCWIIQSMIGTRRSMNAIKNVTIVMLIGFIYPNEALFALSFGQGKKLFNSGKYSEAGKIFETKAQEKPDNSVYLFNQGLANIREGNFEKAGEALNKALVLEIENPKFQSEIYEALAIASFEQGNDFINSDLEKASELWKQSQIDFNNAQNLETKKDSKRKVALEKKKELVERKLKDLIYKDGVQKYKEKNYLDASSSFEKAFQYSEPEEFDELHYNQGNCRYKIGELLLSEKPDETVKTWEKALEDYDEAISLREDTPFPQARRNREILQKRLDELKKQLEEQKQDNQDQSQSEDSEDQNKEDSKSKDKQSSENQKSEQEQKAKENKDSEQKDSSSEKSKSDKNEEGEEQNGQQETGDEGSEKNTSEAAGDKGDQPEEANVIPGRMTREQATQLLEQLKAFERKLPLGNLEHIRKKEAKDNRQGRNW